MDRKLEVLESSKYISIYSKNFEMHSTFTVFVIAGKQTGHTALECDKQELITCLQRPVQNWPLLR